MSHKSDSDPAAILAVRYRDEIAAVAAQCRNGAELVDIGGGFHSIIGTLPCGLTIAVTDDRLGDCREDENDDSTGPFTSELYSDGTLVATFDDGTLPEQLAAAAALSAHDAAALIRKELA